MNFVMFQVLKKFFFQKNNFGKKIFFFFPNKMNPHEVNQQNLITKNPIKKQIKGRTDIIVPFRIQKEDHEEKALIKFEGQMKVFERDGIFSLGISVPQHLEFDKKKHPERIPVEHLEEVIQQIQKIEIQKLLPKIKFNSQDFQLIKDGEFQGGTYSKIWAKMYNDKRTQKPQTNLRKLFFRDGQIKKGKKWRLTNSLEFPSKESLFAIFQLFS